MLEWPAWRVLRWATHFQQYPPLGELGDLLTGILDRIEAVGGVKPPQRTKRHNISRFYSERVPTQAERKQKRISQLKGLPIRTASDEENK